MSRKKKIQFPEVKSNVIRFPKPKDVIVVTVKEYVLNFSKGDKLYLRTTFRKEEIPQNATVLFKIEGGAVVGRPREGAEILAVYYGRERAAA